MSKHSEQTTTLGIHNPFNWVFSNEAERTAYVSVTASDVGKLAYQLDGYSGFMLTSSSPIIWTIPARQQDTVVKYDGYEVDMANPSTTNYATVLSSSFSISSDIFAEIAYSFEVYKGNSSGVQVNVNLDSASIANFSVLYGTTGSGEYESGTFFFPTALRAGSHTIDFQFRKLAALGATPLARRVRLLVINRG